jgi:hypothetical protein
VGFLVPLVIRQTFIRDSYFRITQPNNQTKPNMNTLKNIIRKGKALFATASLGLAASVASATPAAPTAPDLSVLTDYAAVLAVALVAGVGAIVAGVIGYSGAKIAIVSIWNFGRRMLSK